jgi:alkanesulfonate monooxygenase SsuD/methylene tetrahydromethanopterin reductase-like flavin-dependent oxidoreductase (luciferase family)
VSKDFGLLFEIHVARDEDVPPDETRFRVNGDGQKVPVERWWSPHAEHDVYHQSVEQAKYAEQMGFTHAWAVEHHFLEEYSHSSAPEVFLSFVAANTTRMRIGHGVRLLPFPYNHPVKLAEQAAVLDLLAEGRLEVGTGRSATRLELEGFGIDPAHTRGMWQEALEFLVGAWTEDVFEWEGEYFHLPPRSVLPKPHQRPHPPLWVAGTSDESHRIAGELGLGLLSFTLLLPPSELGRRVQIYRDAQRHATPVGKFANNQAAAYTLVHCAETSEQARKNVEDDLLWFMRTNAKEILGGFARWVDPKEPTYDYFQAFAGIAEVDVTYELMTENDMVIVGDPDECIRKVKTYFDSTGIDQLICQMQFGAVPHDRIMESIRLFGEHVIPAVS